MSRNLQRHIDQLKRKILRVGSLVEYAIARSIAALINRDRSLANSVIADDDVIDQLEVDVEHDVLEILALFQPVAGDLRFVVAVLKINNDLERMGDLARNISKRVVYLAECEHIDFPDDVQPMASRVQSMVRQSLESLVGADPNQARKVRMADDDVDLMHAAIQDQVEHQIAMHPERTECLVRLLSVSRHLERLADMATNVAEDVIYMVEGAIVRHQAAT